ncbi:MAG: putative multidrug resistance ABC transporter ATP-binding/permease protein YheI [Chroococcopsis gigantea SAG 12.99]|jgi:ATP-binding cassette subfamily B multidrug efflux pump|nr:ABC transporter ATP-binding protein [Chlorogloea purpurea SAG 13.99]MDV3002076.1 putative multidrug resistance ABC transporter ATP-binding/permease protein YheI [Chroococcopsis gigantea SAG 12.99]
MAYSRVKKLGSYLRPHWRAVSWGVVSLFVANVIGVYIPFLIRDSIDDLSKSFGFDQVVHFVWLMLILATIMWFIRMASRVLLFGVGRQVEFELKQRIFQHLLRLEPAYFSNNTSGDLINRATSDVDSIRRLVGFALLSLANTFFAYGLTLPAMLKIHVPLSIAAVAVYPFMLMAVQLFSGRLQSQQQNVQSKLSDLSDLIQEDMSGISLIKIYAQEENERRAFSLKNRQLLQANLDLVQTRNLLFPIIEALAYVSLILLLGLGSNYISRNNITIGDFIALLILAERLVFPTALLGFTITAYQRGEVSIDRVEAILEVEPGVKNAPGALSLPLESVKGELVARNLSFSYPGSNRPALDGISFTIAPGETVAIVGPVGCGKSTLANAIPRLLNIAPDQLFLDGRDITEIDIKDLRRAIAYVPQESFLFSSNIRDNIRYGDPLKEQLEVESAAKTAQIHDEILNFPQLYETIVGERGITLSGGQRQRSSLARALLVSAPILILDDALSSVDNQTANQILENLSKKGDRTVIFISHQLSAAATADRIFVMDRGRLIQTGTHSQLLERAGLYQTLWNQQQLESALLS